MQPSATALPVVDDVAPEDERLDADARALHRTLEELQRLLQFRDRDRICCHDVSVSQCHALEVVARQGPLTLNELAAALYLEKSTASRVIGGLVSKGYVLRAPHPADRRALQLEATDSGRRLCRTIEADLVAEVRRAIVDMSPEVREATTRVIGRLTQAVSSRVETSAGCCRLL